MDVLSDVLNTLKLKSCLYFTTRFHAPWGIEVPQFGHVARFHLVTQGHCCVRIEHSNSEVTLEQGDIIIIPYGKPHVLSDQPNSSVVQLQDAITESGFNGQGLFEYGQPQEDSQTQLICGHLEFDINFLHPLITQLPDFIKVTSEQLKEFVWLTQAVQSLSQISTVTQMGNDAIVQKLSEIIFIHCIRAWHETLHTENNFLYAIADPHIGKSLQSFHRDPQRKWTLNTLAQEAGLSRTLFAERFKSLVGMPTNQYITQWRIQLARLLLTENQQSIDQIAESVGYESTSAFTRIFKRLVGFGPGAYRKLEKDQTKTINSE